MKITTAYIIGICFALNSFGQTNSTYKYERGGSLKHWTEAANKAAETYTTPASKGLSGSLSPGNLNASRQQSEIPKPYKAPGGDLFNTSTVRTFSPQSSNVGRFYNSECYDELGFSAFKSYESQLRNYEECEAKKLRKRILIILLALFISFSIGAYIAHAFLNLPNLLGKCLIELVKTIKIRLKKIKISTRKKKCQYCQSRVNHEAIVCRYCQRDIKDI